MLLCCFPPQPQKPKPLIFCTALKTTRELFFLSRLPQLLRGVISSIPFCFAADFSLSHSWMCPVDGPPWCAAQVLAEAMLERFATYTGGWCRLPAPFRSALLSCCPEEQSRPRRVEILRLKVSVSFWTCPITKSNRKENLSLCFRPLLPSAALLRTTPKARRSRRDDLPWLWRAEAGSLS